MSDQHKYARKIVGEVEESLSIISEKIEPNSVVLDIGCSSGMLGQYLVGNKACIIDGIDIDDDAIRKCSPLYRKVVIKNLDKDEFVSCFVEQSYDYIVVADVVEHLYDIANLASQLRLLLKPKGTILFSVPNVSHIASALELLYGNFDYRENGLLDSTHIRFFSFDGLVKKLEASGLYAHEHDSVRKDVHETEYGATQSKKFPREWIDAMVAARPDALVYQWIVSAKLYPAAQVTRLEKNADKKSPLFTTALYWASAAHPEFSEARKNFSIAYRNEHGDTVATMVIDAGGTPARLRLDPISQPGIIWIKDVVIKDAHHQPIWKWHGETKDDQLSGATWLGSEIIRGALFHGNDADPHWYLPLDQDALEKIGDGSYLTIVFSDDRARIDSYLARYAKLLGPAEQKAKEADMLRAANAHLTAEIAQCVHAGNELAHALAVSRHSEEHKRQLLEHLYRSKSWKITAPLRSLLELFQGKK